MSILKNLKKKLLKKNRNDVQKIFQLNQFAIGGLQNPKFLEQLPEEFTK